MTTALLLEIFAGFFTAFIALWVLALNRPTASAAAFINVEDSTAAPTPASPIVATVRQALGSYFLREGRLASLGLLILRLAIGAMMIHHGQDKLADPSPLPATLLCPCTCPSRCCSPTWRVTPKSWAAGC